MELPLRDKKPGQQLVFLPEADPEALAEAMVALANASGGLIVLGLDDEGFPTDEIWEEEAESALRAAAARTRPPVGGEWQPVTTRQGVLIGVQVGRSSDLHSLEDGRVLVRSGAENRPLAGPEIQQLATSMSAGDFEATTVAGATIDDFDQHILDEYLAKREARGAPRLGSLSELLFESWGDHAQRRADCCRYPSLRQEPAGLPPPEWHCLRQVRQQRTTC
jgi:ATP-dependent DNA helicase RecG